MISSLRDDHSLHLNRTLILKRFRPFFFLLTFVLAPTFAPAQNQTQWLAATTEWRTESNWSAGIPHADIDALVSNSNYAPFVPVPLFGDTARTHNIKLQNGGELFFDSLAVLIVWGTEVSQQGSLISLGYGTMLFRNNIRFLNGGTFDARAGVLQFQGVIWESRSGSTFDPGTSTVIFEGTVNQDIVVDSSLNLQFYDLQILTQGTVTITGSVTVQNDCYLAAGCTLNTPLGSSFTVNGTFVNYGVITGGGSFSSPLPVQLSSFTVGSQGHDALLRWTTKTELNNYGFEVERRWVSGFEFGVSGSHQQKPQNMEHETSWSSIGFVQGAGTSSSPHDYSYVDNVLSPGRYAYRLKQIDLNGAFAYTNSAEVEVGLTPQEFVLGQNYPNPFNPTTTIEFSLPLAGRATLKVYSIVGQEVATLFNREAGAGLSYQAIFNASSLPSGLYFARLTFGGQTLMKRMTLIK